MAARRRSSEPEGSRRRPATTPEDRENEMIALAYDVAERQMKDGSASSQVITQFLKLGSSRERLEQARLESDARLAEAKMKSIESQERTEQMYKKALDAMRTYAGHPLPEEDEVFED